MCTFSNGGREKKGQNRSAVSKTRDSAKVKGACSRGKQNLPNQNKLEAFSLAGKRRPPQTDGTRKTD